MCVGALEDHACIRACVVRVMRYRNVAAQVLATSRNEHQTFVSGRYKTPASQTEGNG